MFIHSSINNLSYGVERWKNRYVIHILLVWDTKHYFPPSIILNHTNLIDMITQHGMLHKPKKPPVKGKKCYTCIQKGTHSYTVR